MKKRYFSLLGVVALVFTLSNCKRDEPTTSDPVSYDPTPFELDTRDLTPPTISADNPLTVQGVKLGRMLFHETRLSRDNTQSCASCHMQEFAFSDTARLSVGVSGFNGKRQAMAVVNMAYNTNEFFWDGRAHLLRHQALLPIQDSLEMDEELDSVVAKLSRDQSYVDQFIRAFGNDSITPVRISLALEQFMNTIVSVNSKYDQYLRGDLSLTAAEQEGRRLFFAEFNPGFPDSSGADCAHCHGGSNFEDDSFKNNGLDADADFHDLGREMVTGNASDRALFKVPTLRNVELTAPYMHDGRFSSLEEVVQHYNSGMVNSSTIDAALTYPLAAGGLQLDSTDVFNLVAFLKTLTDDEMVNNPEYASPF